MEENKETVPEEELNTETEQNSSEEEEAVETTETDASTEEVEDLKKELDRLQKEKDEIYNRMLRNQAEFDNFKKRTQKEKEADRKYKSQDLVNELLPALDNFERALQIETTEENKGFVEGITMVYKQLIDALTSQGVEVIETVGKEFDPTYHHAVMQVEDENHEPNTVVEELQKGYVLKDRVIRPAMVKVNK
ncbi:nucleotide exchange factor GrpE [Ornithinibacillus sp. L9]|uniref:Protein GrpE n=1 Tax=Ornithinibacillus caprae TaxID=2678566 RepID=A0A6N8FGA2_9BACI|nr:nucleotide exchange factor GrpE [Ornithinibacillus caprae]MUK87077.1 nucleotide exchange factor GrpE [Ornithinibacillus caprae]